MSAKKTHDIPTPPIPRSLLDPGDPSYIKPEPLKPDEIRARLQLQAVIALDVMEWHARNLADPKSSEDACRELLDRAGYVAPAKTKGDGLFSPGAGGGSLLPPVEEDTKALADAFSAMPTRRRAAEEED